ncbi:phenylalanine--tRNA ligase subunit beta [Candidatus Wolfebacteria bacterium]|nr:phenylalanine--tRNA ligase subunit beta [Candidatus Wolfebacteria bacterium]
MKFSYSLIKKLVPKVKNKKELILKLNSHSFETEDLGGDIFDVSLPPNRFSDAASHWGIAAEISAILGGNFQIKNLEFRIKNFGDKKAPFKVIIRDKNLCSRYMGQYFDNVKVGPSPKWMQKILIDCGLRPVNNVVDVINYAMLETGQPLHAFDYDKIEANNREYQREKARTIVVRRAKKGEKIETLDDKIYELNENILVIADKDKPLAIAGIKGGKAAEVNKNTKRIVVEAANFDGVNIYRASKFLKFQTDASLRFSHNISSELAALGLNRAAQLLKDVSSARAGQIIDVNYTKQRKKVIKFDLEKFNKFIGMDLDIKIAKRYLENLGFGITPGQKFSAQNSFFVTVPDIRRDVETFEDLTEEVARLYGYNNLKSKVPRFNLIPSGFEDQIVLKDKIRKILIGFGFSEVYNYSFIGETDLNDLGRSDFLELDNPISVQFKYLRPSLATHLLKNIDSNSRFFDSLKIFEIGRVFLKDKNKLKEKIMLGLIIASKNKETFFELKGIIREFLKKVGLVDFSFVGGEEYLKIEKFAGNFLEKGAVLGIKSNNTTIGYLGEVMSCFSLGYCALAQIDLGELLKLAVEEHEYKPLPKYPSVIRDLSVAVSELARIGDIMQEIQMVNAKYIEDVDLIDEFDITRIDTDSALINADNISVNPRDNLCESAMRRSFTFRIIFQAEDRTLTDEEVNKEIKKIENILQSKFEAKIR